MSLTKITWEEFDAFDKIESPKGYDFRTHEGKYYTFLRVWSSFSSSYL